MRGLKYPESEKFENYEKQNFTYHPRGIDTYDYEFLHKLGRQPGRCCTRKHPQQKKRTSVHIRTDI